MRCTKARSTYLAAELEPEATEARVSLRRHLEECPSCAAWASQQEQLVAGLASLRTDFPIDLDVTARVAAGLAGLQDVRDEDVSVRALAWASGLAVLAGAGLIAGFTALLPDLSRAAVEGWTLLASMRHAAGAILETATTVAVAGLGFLEGLLVAAGDAVSGLDRFAPLAITAAALGSTMMGTTVVLVVGREFRRASWIREERR